MSAAPVFSVCVLCWQSEEFIGEALESVRAQDFGDWECWICDDASKDGTARAASAFLRDERFRFHTRETNLGQAGNWAEAIGRCRGRFLSTLHADDVLEAGALRAFHDAFQDGADLVWGNWEYWDETLGRRLRAAPVRDARFDGMETLRWLAAHNHTLPSATAFCGDLLRRAGPPDSACGIFCDREFFLRLAAHSRGGRALGRSIVRYRQHRSSTTSDSFLSGKFQTDMLRMAKVLEREFSGSPATRELVGPLKAQCAEAVYLSAADALLRGRAAFGWRWAREAWKLSGLSLLRPRVFLGLARRLKARLFDK